MGWKRTALWRERERSGLGALRCQGWGDGGRSAVPTPGLRPAVRLGIGRARGRGRRTPDPRAGPAGLRHGVPGRRCADGRRRHACASTRLPAGPKRAVLRTRTKGRNGLCQKPCAAFLGQLLCLHMRQPVTPITMGMRVSMTAQNCPSAWLLGDRELNQFQKNRMNRATAP